jgi:hypothetical protein
VAPYRGQFTRSHDVDETTAMGKLTSTRRGTKGLSR